MGGGRGPYASSLARAERHLYKLFRPRREQEPTSEETKEVRTHGAKDPRSEGAKGPRSEGAKDPRSQGAKDPRRAKEPRSQGSQRIEGVKGYGIEDARGRVVAWDDILMKARQRIRNQ